jgi:hypothetical protein
MTYRPIHIRSTSSVHGCPQLLEQRPAIVGAAEPLNRAHCSPPVYRSSVCEPTAINEPDRTFITQRSRPHVHGERHTFTNDDRFTRFVGPIQPSIIDQPQGEGT